MCRCTQDAQDRLETAAVMFAMEGTRQSVERLLEAARDFCAVVAREAAVEVSFADEPTVPDLRARSPLVEPRSDAA